MGERRIVEVGECGGPAWHASATIRNPRSVPGIGGIKCFDIESACFLFLVGSVRQWKAHLRLTRP